MSPQSFTGVKQVRMVSLGLVKYVGVKQETSFIVSRLMKRHDMSQ